jgi:hypothetical protein
MGTTGEKKMKLNLIIEGNHNASRLHTLHVMREMALSGRYAPMNVDLFYDQFFNPALLSNDARAQLDAVKDAWLSVFDHFTCYMDYGLDTTTDETLKGLQRKHPNSTFEYGMLATNLGHLRTNEHSDLREAYFYQCGDDPSFADMLSFVTDNDLSATALPEHLPEHFATYTQPEVHTLSHPHQAPRRVIFESPFAGDMQSNTEYAAQAITKLIMQEGVAPMASHLLYTRMLDDTDGQERNIGIDAGLAYGQHAHSTIVALDRGMSTGMRYGIKNAEAANRPLTFLTLSGDPKVQADVKQISGFYEAVEWIAAQQKKHAKHFEKTGFVTPTAENRASSTEVLIDQKPQRQG